MKQRLLLKTMLLLCALVAGSSSVWATDPVVIWSEDFTGLAANATPTTPTNASFTGVTYTCVDGLGTSPGSTKVMNENLAKGAASPELMVGKKGSGTGAAGGKFTAVIPLDNFEGTLTLTYYQNKQSLKVSSTTTGVSGGQTVKPTSEGQQTTTFTGITKTMTSITIVFEATTTNNVRLDDIVLTGTKATVTPSGTTAAPSISGDESFLNTTTVTIINDASADGATIYYTLNGDDPTTTTSATCFAYSVPFSIDATTTVKAIAKHADDDNASSVVSKTFTKITPISVSEARAAIDAGTGTTGVYVQGIVYEGGSSLSSGAMNYWISDDGTETDKFEIYKGKSFDGANFSAVSDVQVGDVVVVYGNIKKYNSTYEFDSGSQLISLVRQVATPTFSPDAGAVIAGTEVAISCATDGATIYYTTDGTNPTIGSSVYSAPITIDAAKTIKAFAVKDGNPDSEIATAAYTIAAPAEAPTFSPAAGTYYAAQSVTLSTATDGATIYYTTNGDEPTTASTEYTGAITVDETMTVKAIAAKDGMANSSVAEATYTILTPTITVSNNIQFNYDEAPKTLAVTYENVSADKPTVKYYESDGTTETTYDWFTAVIDGDNNLLVTPEENEGDAARLGYVKIFAKGVDDSDVSSALITVTQIKPTVDYATLPFSFDDQQSKISSTKGLTHTGLGSDYSSKPYLKFDTTGDELILKIKEVPGTLSFDIKNNSFSGGTFKVQVSANGATYTDLATYTTITNTQSETFNNLAADVRYIKWVYTEKVSGNVGLGNIKLNNTVDVKLAASDYASFCSPVPLDLTPGEGYAAYAVTATSDATVTFTKIPGAVPAETPFILYGEGKGGTTINLPVATGATTAVADNMLVGTLAPTAITTVSGDYTNFGLSGGSFVKINDGTLPANKAYLPVLTANLPSSSAPEFTIIFEDMQTTGVNAVKGEGFTVNGYYDLQGRKVANPTKGLYIVNGKKVIVK